MYTKIVTPETTFAITLKQLKDHLRIDVGDEDALLTNLMIAAHDLVVNYLGKSLTTRTIRAYYNNWRQAFTLPSSPVQSITSVKYYDNTGSSTAVSSDVYYFTPGDSYSKLVKYDSEVWPSADLRLTYGIEIEYVAGYGDTPSDIPFGIRQGVLHTAAAMYENREDNSLPILAQSILGPYKEMNV